MDTQQTFCFLLFFHSVGALHIQFMLPNICFLKTQAREFANELRASTKVSRNPTVWLEGSTGSSQNANTDTSAVSDAYAKMLTIFIPLLVDEVFIKPLIFRLTFKYI